MQEEWRALMEQYPDQWVAMDADGLVAVADSQRGAAGSAGGQGSTRRRPGYQVSAHQTQEVDLLIVGSLED